MQSAVLANRSLVEAGDHFSIWLKQQLPKYSEYIVFKHGACVGLQLLKQHFVLLEREQMEKYEGGK